MIASILLGLAYLAVIGGFVRAASREGSGRAMVFFLVLMVILAIAVGGTLEGNNG